ncbi:MAG: hypothetical protein ACOZNI_25720 [Myxococcota bacterium]
MVAARNRAEHTYVVRTCEEARMEVVAANWLIALGGALEALDRRLPTTQIACEHLANGTVIVRSATPGEWFLVAPVSTDALPIEPTEEEIVFGGEPDPEEE